MITLHRKDKTFEIPTEWKDVTLGRWQLGIAFARGMMPPGLLKEFDGEKRGDVSTSEILKWKTDWVGHWSGLEHAEIQDLPMKNTKDAIGVLTLYESLSKFLTFPYENLIEEFEFKGKTYKVAKETLDAAGEKVPMGNASWGELSDAMHLHENVSKIGKGKVDALPMLLATLFKSGEETVEDRTDLFRGLPMDTVLGCCFFLTQLLVTSFKNTVLSLGAEKEATSVGIPPPLVLRGRVYSDPTMKSENEMLTTSSHT